MMTQVDRDREALIQSIMQMAKDFRYHNRFDYDHPVITDIPAGAKYLITQRDVEFLKVMHIHISEENPNGE